MDTKCEAKARGRKGTSSHLESGRPRNEAGGEAGATVQGRGPGEQPQATWGKELECERRDKRGEIKAVGRGNGGPPLAMGAEKSSGLIYTWKEPSALCCAQRALRGSLRMRGVPGEGALGGAERVLAAGMAMPMGLDLADGLWESQGPPRC